jgi:hypothetical protein
MRTTSIGLTLLWTALAGAVELSEADQKAIRENYELSLLKVKGPFAENFCICEDGAKEPVAGPDGKTPRAAPCGARSSLFCAAFRAPHAVLLGEKGLYVANVFSRDLYNWDGFPDHHDLVRGYLLEDDFIQTHPEHKYAQMRAYGGLSGAEYEAADALEFFERYLALPRWSDFRHYLLTYELQRRYFTRPALGQIHKIRDLALRLKTAYPSFKPICDAIHNRISPVLIPKVLAFRDALPPEADRDTFNALMGEIDKLTRVSEADLAPQLVLLSDESLRSRLGGMLPTPEQPKLEAIASLGSLMAAAREAVASRALKPSDARVLIDLAIMAAAVVHTRTTALLDQGQVRTVRDGLRLLAALTDATYGTGLLSRRERNAAAAHLQNLLGSAERDQAGFYAELQRAERVVEWAQNTVRFAFAEVLPAWSLVMPDVAFIGDDILRASPLLVYAQVARRLEDHAARDLRLQSEIFGIQTDRLRALNPGLALGPLLFAPAEGRYTRGDVVALLQTPAELQPVAGILTQGEGNVVSHVQLLARSLGIPNVVLEPGLMQRLAEADGRRVFFLATPLGRVFLKDISRMTPKEHEIVAEYTRNKRRSGNGALGGGAGRLHIDRTRLDLSDRQPVDLLAIRRKDSGVRCGPKAAFLGELKALFPQSVSRGIVLPFGIYYEHYRRADVAVPDALRSQALALPGEKLSAFVERTYAEFFGKMVGSGIQEEALSAWIKPRLEIIQHSIRQAPLSPQVRLALREEFRRQGLFLDAREARTVGCFVRSDTNVEDLPSFNGAGLNLTLFNLGSFDQILEGIKQVWASPFSFRSFSWRQTLIDEPLWVLPSIVILESVPSAKSGVLITADVESGDPAKMTVGTSEGVGGAVDGTPAETLLWAPERIELLAQFKSPWRRLLRPEGGVAVVPSTGREIVLERSELEQLIAAAQTIGSKLEPERDEQGRPRPWDIEFGFADGRLWLFQSRGFIGNEQINNIPALSALDQLPDSAKRPISIEEVLR